MAELLMLKGIPGSGKSTLAKSLASNSGYIRVNKDDLRAMLYDGNWKPKKERLVVKARDGIIQDALERGQSVVVDDTNFNPAHEERLRQLAREGGATFRVQLIDVPLQDALERNRRRSDKEPVPESVIRDMWTTNIRGPVWYDDSLPMATIVDIDGTLAHMNGRSPYDWHRVGEDTIDEQVRAIVNNLHTQVVVMSGRDAVCRDETEEWLSRNEVDYDALIMRAKDDMRKDNIVKRELFEEHVRPYYYPWLVIDDRDQVVSMWRDELGLKVWQVAWGSF